MTVDIRKLSSDIENELLKSLEGKNQVWFQVYDLPDLSVGERIAVSHWLRGRMGRPRRGDAVFVLKRERFVERGMPRIRWLIGKKYDLKVSPVKHRHASRWAIGEERPE